MSQPEKSLAVQSSAITDRGLNERRPLNEDAFLADSERCIFAVADGVGGAEAGEVASQTAMEVLDEAFRHQVGGSDIEDLMELAIQRANASIHRMSQEHSRFSMMATTIVALHLKGNIATIGHVGDSRLYRLTPEGHLVRETEDHSVVEEEVRAGRMTPEQAANHPSKNVISRALGAEESVEVDMKTTEVEDGTQFLLCTDGITRHVPDYEIRQLLIVNDELGKVCEELKQRCFERGAEDNLTAVLVRVGKPISAGQRLEELEATVSPEAESPSPGSDRSNVAELDGERTVDALVPPSRIAFPAPDNTAPILSPAQPLSIGQPQPSSVGRGRALSRATTFILVLAVVAGAFYAGRRYRGQIPFLVQRSETIEPVSTSSTLAEDSLLKFERSRRDIDKDPAAWLSNQMKNDLVAEGIQNPLESASPHFLYLYGRASLLTGKSEEAAIALEHAVNKADLNPSPENSTVRKEAILALAALSLRSDKDKSRALSHYEEMLQQPSPSNSP